MKLKNWFTATRPWSFVMTLVSSGLGAILAAQDGYINLTLFLVTLFGLICFHAATNLLNDYYDFKHKVDRPGSPTTRYRKHPLLTGEFRVSEFLLGILALYLLMVSSAVYLTLLRGWIIIILTATGIFFSVFYTADPIKFKHRPIGEIAVFLTWGPLMILGTYYVISGVLTLNPVLASIPLGLLVSLVLFANNMRDREYDAEVGVRTLAVILGQSKSLKLFKYLLVSVYIVNGILVFTRILSPLSLLVFITLPQALNLIKTFSRRIPEAADPMVAQLTLKFGLLLIVGELLKIFLPPI